MPVSPIVLGTAMFALPGSILLLATFLSTPVGVDDPSEPTAAFPPIPAPARPLAKAEAAERQAIDRLQGSLAWPRRVVALLRLQRFDCPDSEVLLRQ